MKINGWLFVLSIALIVPAQTWSQPVTRGAQEDATESFNKMQLNVSTTITAPAEKARWNENVELWKIKRSHEGALTKADIEKMTTSYEAMKANVGAITDAAEKERWQANCNLWKVALNPWLKLSATDMDKAQAALKTISANVAKVTLPAEKGRWEANRDLWRATIARM